MPVSAAVLGRAQRDHQVIASQGAVGPVQDAIAIGVFEAHIRQDGPGGIRAVGVVDHRTTIEVGRSGVKAARPGPQEGAAHNGLCNAIAVDGLAEGTAEAHIAEQFTQRSVTLVLDTKGG